MTHVPAPPFAHTSGSAQPKIVFVGEAWGKEEEATGKPFVGESGKEFFRMLLEAFSDVEPELGARICELHRYGNAWIREREAWFEAAGLALTNVLAFRPPDNKLEALCGNKKEVGGDNYKLPPITKGKYLRPEFLVELDRLYSEINTWNPNLIVCLGNTACWAILKATNIGSIRGTVTEAHIPTEPQYGIL
jgi:uracil-DNA glycosylase